MRSSSPQEDKGSGYEGFSMLNKSVQSEWTLWNPKFILKVHLKYPVKQNSYQCQCHYLPFFVFMVYGFAQLFPEIFLSYLLYSQQVLSEISVYHCHWKIIPIQLLSKLFQSDFSQFEESSLYHIYLSSLCQPFFFEAIPLWTRKFLKSKSPRNLMNNFQTQITNNPWRS